MKTLCVLSTLLLASSFGCKKDKEEDAPKDTSQATAKDSAEAVAPPPEGGSAKDKGSEAAEPAPEPEPEPEGLAMVDFPNTSLDAEVGDYVFSPNDSSFKSAHEGEERDLGRFSWGVMKVVSKGEKASEVKSMMGQYEMPNAYLLPIKGGDVEVGDIVAASKYGNNLDRAYVTKVGDSVEANFMRTQPYGDKKATLKPSQFFKLQEGILPGSPVGVRVSGKTGKGKIGKYDITTKSPDSMELFTVLRVEGDTALLTGHMGKVVTAPTAAIVPLPLKPALKKGDAVFAVWDTLHFMEGKIKKIDSKLGHYEVDFGSTMKVKTVPFGEVLVGSKADYLQ